MTEITAPEQRTIAVEDVRTEGRTLHGFAALYNAESRDLGGFTETIMPGAFTDVLAGEPDVYLTFNHSVDKILARTTSGTLRLRDEERGLAFEADLGDGPTAQDVRDMVKRGDVSGASFRFVVSPDGERWEGERRTLTKIGELIDLSLATTPAYDGPRVELRTRPTKEEPMDEQTSSEGGVDAAIEDEHEERTTTPAGTLRVRDRDEGGAESRTLWAAFQSAGFQPGGGRAEVSWPAYMAASENRAITVGTSTLDQVGGRFFGAPPLQYDSRWAWPALTTVPVDSATTSVNVLAETSRTLIAGGTAVRTINATSSKPEVALTVLNTPTELKQIAGVVAGIPNIVLQQAGIESLIANDLRLSYGDGLDFHVCQGINTCGTQTLATDPLLNVIRRCVTVLRASGFAPDTCILTPSNSETLDLMMAGGTVGYPGSYVFGAGQFGPSSVFGMNVRVSKNIGNPVVLDSTAFGKVYASPVSLASFEENAGLSNTSLVRLEGNAVLGIERLTAAVKIT